MTDDAPPPPAGAPPPSASSTPPYEYVGDRPPDLVRLLAAQRAYDDVADLVDPAVKGALGCGGALVHAGAVAFVAAFMVAPCTGGLVVGGVVPAVILFVVGGFLGVPFALKLSRRLRARMLAAAAKNAARPPALPKRAGGGASSSTAVPSADQVDDEPRRPHQ